MLIWSSWIATQDVVTEDDWSWRDQDGGGGDDHHHHHPTSFEEYKKLPYQSNQQIDSIVAYLMDLAKTPPSDLWDIFGMDNDNINNKSSDNNMKNYGKDVFSLQQLEQGKCPTNIGTVGWLPPKPWNSDEISTLYQSKVAELKSSNKNKKMRGPVANQQSTEVILWYEHMSKAGGTTFCGLAKTNLGRDLVPKYYCMPKRQGSKDYDGRVGSWTNDELISYANREAHYIVANEWDPFNIDKLALSGRSLDGQKVPSSESSIAGRQQQTRSPPRLLFVTTLRDPADRLLSTYLFFRHKENPPEFGQWLKSNQNRIRNFQIGMKGAFRSNVARYNAIVWRYSGGKLRHRLPEEAVVVVASEEQKKHGINQNNRFPVPMMDENYWKDPFETAIRALMQLDVILPMDVMTKEEGQETMRRILGWDEVAIKDGRGKGDKDNGHIVTTGKIRNSNAREYLSEEDYRFMWEANWLDNILVLWCRAVFLARLHCKDA
ncbi:hypothetical protein ACHAWC_010397 [Mediolabrus comicus]